MHALTNAQLPGCAAGHSCVLHAYKDVHDGVCVVVVRPVHLCCWCWCCCCCRYWTLAEAKPQHWDVLQDALPSDLRFRQDLAALAAGDLEQAQHYKEVLERQQRSDRKLREAAGVFEH